MPGANAKCIILSSFISNKNFTMKYEKIFMGRFKIYVSVFFSSKKDLIKNTNLNLEGQTITQC